MTARSVGADEIQASFARIASAFGLRKIHGTVDRGPVLRALRRLLTPPREEERGPKLMGMRHAGSGGTYPPPPPTPPLVKEFSQTDTALTPADLGLLGEKLMKLAETGIAFERPLFYALVDSILISSRPGPSDNLQPTSTITGKTKAPAPAPALDKEILTAAEAADFLGFEIRLLGTMRRDGTGPAFSEVRGRGKSGVEYRYQKKDLVAWLEACKKG